MNGNIVVNITRLSFKKNEERIQHWNAQTRNKYDIGTHILGTNTTLECTY